MAQDAALLTPNPSYVSMLGGSLSEFDLSGADIFPV